MSSGMQTPHLRALGAHQRQEVGRELQSTLVEPVDLSLIGTGLDSRQIRCGYRSDQ